MGVEKSTSQELEQGQQDLRGLVEQHDRELQNLKDPKEQSDIGEAVRRKVKIITDTVSELRTTSFASEVLRLLRETLPKLAESVKEKKAQFSQQIDQLIQELTRVKEQERLVDEVWKDFSPEEKKKVVEELTKGPEITQQQQFRLKQVELMARAVDALAKTLEQGGSTKTQWLAIKFMPSKDLERFKNQVKIFQSDKLPVISERIKATPEMTLRTALIEVGSLQLLKTFATRGVHFNECKREQDLLGQECELVIWLRSIHNYQVARQLCEEALAP